MSSRHLRLPSGRALGISVLGDPAAQRTVLLCHPAPGASGFDPDPRATQAAAARIVSYDRPGYGSSDPLPALPIRRDSTLEELAAVEELVERGGGRVDGIVGWGLGGLAALELAAARPRRIRRVVLVQTPRPRNRDYGVRARRAREWSLQHRDPQLAHEAIVAGTGISDLSVLGARDDDPALRVPGLRERLERMLDESVRQGDAGIAGDRRMLRLRDWSRVARSVRARVLLVYGAHDERMGRRDARWFARRLQRPRVELVRGAGPLAIASEWGRILDFVAGPAGRGRAG
ncbi:alpha/beta fold hydrolase [Gryllotalpicola ginsengisoli]|uniref:alpha/beta fold hydrolase n=1 Tax=Gryllotalpicola ginsengisoli TaxID=444608 RepID=UPI0003B66CE2|nr:alpha/beta hydrolase [Gryllotalpicola ginsengisoli]